MKILVTTKRVTDPEANIKLKPDNTGIVTDGIEFKLNPFCENAVEAALQLREAHGGEVVAVSVGPEDAKTYMRTALAMGADRGIMVSGDDDNLDGDLVARIFAEVYKREQPDVFLLGKQCIDGDSNQVGQLMAEYLGLPQACFASEIEIADGTATVSREVDGGIEVINVDLPAVITADLRLNEPRFYGLPGIIKARKKEILDFTQEELGVSSEIKVATQRYEPPSERQAGVMVETVSELVEKLQNEAKVL